MSIKNPFLRSISTKLAFAAVVTIASPAAMAAVVCSTAPITIPNTSAGIYINFVTGATGTTAMAGFDINPWGATTIGGLAFYMGADVDANNGAVFGTTYTNLPAGSAVGPAQTFSGVTTTAANMAPWRVTQTGGYLGVRFTNEATGAINYGWLQINTTAATGFPAVINRYCYDNLGAAILTGTTPVTLQNFSVD